MRYRVTHQTRYDYSEPVTLCHNEIRKRPRDEQGQRCESFRITIDPAPAYRSERLDHFFNQVCYFDVEHPHRTLRVTATSVCETQREPELPYASAPWEMIRDALPQRGSGETNCDPAEFLYTADRVSDFEVIREFATQSFGQKRPILDAVAELNYRIYSEFVYDQSATQVETSLSEVFKSRRGVCQDFAHVGVAVLRSLGLCAAYVSGYLETQPPPGTEKLRGVDASHAWFSVYIPASGWHDFDPTNNQTPDERYITVGRGRDYSDVAPLRGVVFGGGQMTLSVAVDVMPEN